MVDFIAIAPAAVPGIFFGIGYATAFNQRWLDWMDRGTLITISMVFWNIPVGYRAAVAGLQQIDRSIDEAATSLGRRQPARVPRRAAADPARAAHDRSGDRLRARDHDPVGRHLPVHAADGLATITIFQLVNDFNWGGATAFTVSVITMAIARAARWSGRSAGRRVRSTSIPNG